MHTSHASRADAACRKHLGGWSLATTVRQREEQQGKELEPHKDELIMLPVEVVKVIAPQILGVSRVDKAVAVGRALDEHMRWQIVQIPVRGYFDKPCILALDQRLHPLFRFLGVVDLCPGIISPQVISLTVVMAHAVIVFNAIRQQELSAFATGLPPRVL